jgi:hypothetical protein
MTIICPKCNYHSLTQCTESKFKCPTCGVTLLLIDVNQLLKLLNSVCRTCDFGELKIKTSTPNKGVLKWYCGKNKRYVSILRKCTFHNRPHGKWNEIYVE